MIFFFTNKYALFILRALVTVSLLTLFLLNFDIKSLHNQLNKNIIPSLAFSLLLLTFALFIISFRWFLINTFFKLPLLLSKSFLLVLIGHFFNQLLPTSIGGDFFRSYALWKNNNSFKLSILSVVLDRFIGLSALLVLILLGLPLLSLKLSSNIPMIIATSLFICSLGIFVLFVNLEKFKSIKSFSLFTKIVNISIKGKSLIYSKVLIISVLISFIVHSSSLIIIYLISNSIGGEITLMETLLVVPAVLLITALPISIGGWGVREAGLVGGFALIGLDTNVALATSILYGSVNVFVGLLGGLLFLFYRH